MSLYIQMVSKWIYEGNVDDRHGEFMIMVDETAGEWTEWNEKYTLRNDQVPTIFQKDSHVMLITGKYLNILKVCNKTINHPFTRELQDHLDSHIRAQNFTETIARAYDWAN